MDFLESELTNEGERSERGLQFNGNFNGETSTYEVEAQRHEIGQYGEKLKYDPAGPFQKARVRTDYCWFTGFILFIVVWLIIIIYGFSMGDADKWLEPIMDSEGRVCGKDPGVEKMPYLVRFNNDTCDDCFICWTSCPVENFKYLYSEPEAKKKEDKEGEVVLDIKNTKEKIIRTSEGEMDVEKHNIEEDKMVEKDAEKTSTVGKKADSTEKPSSPADKRTRTKKEVSSIGVKEDTNNKKTSNEDKTNERKSNEDTKKINSVTEKAPKENTADGKSHKPKGSDDSDVVETRKKYMICKPEVMLELIQRFPELDHLVRSKKCAETYERAPEAKPTDKRCNDGHVEIEKKRFEVSRMSRDLSNTKFSITGFVFISAVIALISIFAMRWFALFYICGLIVVAIPVFFYLTYDKIVSDIEDRTTGVLLALFFCIVEVVIFVLLVLYFRKEIFKTCKMIKESSKAITGLIWTLLLSLLIAFIYGMILSMGVNLHFALSSIETPIHHVDLEPGNQCICPPELGYTQNATCDPVTFNSVCLTADQKRCAASGCYLIRYDPHPVGFLHFINYVGLYWSFWFCFGFADSVLASVFSNWYWTFNKKILTYMTLIEGFWTIGFYHLGTIALGSIIILICEITRCVLTVFCKLLEKSKRPCMALILMHMRWVYDLLETFLSFINSRAYVACAMHGTDFLHSARSAYYLMMRNLNKVHRVAEISNWVTFILALLISSVVSKISVGYYQSREDEVMFANVPAVLVFVGSLLVTWLMLRVVEVAVETIYQCFLEDSERNDGSSDKPFFASEQLSKILYKRQI